MQPSPRPPSPPSPPSSPDGIRIAEVVRRTGVAKDLIHHYLRQGLLPRSAHRGRYDDRQVRLLAGIRSLREEHFLPLEAIGQLFERLSFDPTRVEALVAGESEATALARFAGAGALFDDRLLSGDEAAAMGGLDGAHFDACVEAGIAHSVGSGLGGGEARFSVYDAQAAALCGRGVALGIPFETFRVIASYVRVAAALEQDAFLRTEDTGVEGLVGDLFVRCRIASAFVASVLDASFLDRQMSAPQVSAGTGLAALIHVPSAAFARRHGIDAAIDAARALLCERPDDLEVWRRLSGLLLYAGRHREVVFFAEEGLRRWPQEVELRVDCGCALLALGETQRAEGVLARAETPGGPGVRVSSWRAVARWLLTEGVEETLRRAPGMIATLEVILTSGEPRRDADSPWRRASSLMLAGRILVGLPPVLQCREGGLRLLRDAVDAAAGLPPNGPLPGWTESLRLNTAWLLAETLAAGPCACATEDTAEENPGGGRACDCTAEIESLVQRVCRLDPGSDLADRAFALVPPLGCTRSAAPSAPAEASQGEEA